MKSTERHRLKQNEFAATVARARATLENRRRTITTVLMLLAVVLVAVAAYSWWRGSREARANAMLAEALAIYETPVVPPPPPAPGSPPPLPQPGTFQSEKERLDAALPPFVETAEAHPNRPAGITARFHAASILAALGRHAEAEEHYRRVHEQGGDGIYSRTAQLGLAETQLAQQKFDSAIAILDELARDAGSPIPVDGVLMHLGRAYLQAGRTEEAVRSFTRIVDEFPQSPYAAEARRQMAERKS